MAVLGATGQLRLKREAPPACILSPEALSTQLNSFNSICPGYWSGDHISVDCLPVQRPGQLPGNPDAWASYQESRWYVGPNRDHISRDGDIFYKQGAEDYPDGQENDAAQFYVRVGDVSDGNEIIGCVPGDYYIHIDALGRVSFYTSRCEALAGCKSGRLELVNVGQEIIVAPIGSTDYLNAVWECYGRYEGDYIFSDAADSITLISICADAPTYQKPEANPNEEAYVYDNANVLPRSADQTTPLWEIVCELREWSLTLDAPAVDTTSVAEKWGNAVKSLVNGGGSTEFFIDRKCFEDGQTNGLTLMRLLLMTEKGCKAQAQFYMLQRPGPCGPDSCAELLPGDLYYEADILITQTAVNLRPTEMVAGTAEFVTTGEIALLEASPSQ